MKITAVKNEEVYEKEGLNGEVEKYYNQEITAIIKSGEYKGKSITLNNTCSYSGVKDEGYKKGNYLFVSLSGSEDKLSANILSVKRDMYVMVLICVFILGIVIFAGKKGVLSIISIIMNIIIFTYALNEYVNGKDILKLCNLMIILFTMISLILASGINKQTVCAIISTLISVALIFIIYKITKENFEQPEYMMMEYITNPEHLDHIFMAGVLIGGLGAIMDVAISISVAVNELINKDKNISVKNLISSVKEIGYDIMGTMINVLFFTYMCGTIPMLILKIKNGYKFLSIIKFQIPFEIIRFLVGAIGIVVTIPISGFIAITILKKRRQVND
ncbi:YibE/F family protein [uncultured Clostridium sp.]|uniref:YibE/F family protein n=1 Tax=uncultured Clostridium sp. TaxID=59620 RepID=UPI0026DBF60A|nr:YibE/F family protein [uncultured Clostridium sp.]